MNVADDVELLEEYAKNRSEAAFTMLVDRHLNLVHSAASRQVGDPHLAEEVTQAVFIALARKASTFRSGSTVTSWLYRATRYAALDALKTMRQRRRHEQEAACMQTETNDPEPSAWNQAAPSLDEAMADLREKDRTVILLRYFHNRSLAEVGAALGTSDEAAKKRVARALERLRKSLSRRSAIVSTGVIGALLSANAVQAAPATLSSSIKAAALLEGTSAAASTVALAKATLKVMAWAKLKMAAGFGAGALLVGGAAAGAYWALQTSGLPPEPVYRGLTLRQWTGSEPRIPVVSYDDIMSLRRTALAAMGDPAVRYLCWLVRHPERISEGAQPLPAAQTRGRTLILRPPDVPGVVVGLQLLGPKARAAAPDLVRLWESGFNDSSILPLVNYNGFPLTLAELGDSSPAILAALHRHFKSPDPLHSALCAFAAWRLKPDDAEAVGMLHRELTATDDKPQVREVLVDTFARYATNAGPFLPEIRTLIGREADHVFAASDAKAAWRILHEAAPAKAMIDRLGQAACQPGATPDQVNLFAASALEVAEVPGINKVSAPMLERLSNYPDASAAQFASNILVKLDRR